MSPAARTHVARNKLDPKRIRGTGKNGIILKSDVFDYLKSAPVEPIEKPSRTSQQTIPSNANIPKIDYASEFDVVVPVDRKRVQEMTSANSIPFFVYNDAIDVTELLKFSKGNEYAFFTKAASIAIKEFPLLNTNVNPEVDANGYIQEYVLKTEQNFDLEINDKSLSIQGIESCSIGEIVAKVESQDSQECVSTFQVTQHSGAHIYGTIKSPATCVMSLGRIQTIGKYDSENRLQPRQIVS